MTCAIIFKFYFVQMTKYVSGMRLKYRMIYEYMSQTQINILKDYKKGWEEEKAQKEHQASAGQV